MDFSVVKKSLHRGDFLRKTRDYMAKHLLSSDYRYTRSMEYAADDVRPQIISNDYVRSASLELVAHEIQRNEVMGSVAELGVYRGDFAMLINRVFPDRTLYLFDTFEGFDEADVKCEIREGYSSGTQDFSDTSLEIVLGKMLHMEKCVVKKGSFPQTTEGLEEERFAFVSVDADLYQPIYEGLKFFYPRLSRGGAIFIHDFNNVEYKGAAQAVREYCAKEGISYFPLCDNCGTAVIVK